MKHTSEEIKNRLSNIGEAIGNIALDYIAALEKENAELKTKVTALENANRAMVKELDDITSGGLNILQNVVKNKEELANAKEIIREFMKYEINEYDGSLEIHFEELKKQAEQFISEVEK